MPGQFLLHYYTDPKARKFKGEIDLDQCEQVDTGLTYQSGKISYQFMFDIKTPKRVYYLAADTETEMTAWVDWVCQVCGLRTFASEEEVEVKELPQPAPPPAPGSLTVGGRLPSPDSELVTSQPQAEGSISSPYMHLSECFTGGPNPLVTRLRPGPNAAPLSRYSPDYQNSPSEQADNSINCGDDSVFLPVTSLHPPTCSFSHLSLSDPPGPPSAPGRPPKSAALRTAPVHDPVPSLPPNDTYENHEDIQAGQALLGTVQDKEANNNTMSIPAPSHAPPSVDRRLKPERVPASLTLGPPVQRNRKPHSDLILGTYPGPSLPHGMTGPTNSESDTGSNSPDGSRRNSVDEQIYFYMPSLQQSEGTFMIPCTDPALDHCVQYLDLDLPAPGSSSSVPKDEQHPSTVYKTVDFIKTEAFNRTRQKVEEYKYNIKPDSK